MSQLQKFTLPPAGARVHFIGVLGAGMLPLARLLISRGYRVSGSDLRAPDHPLPEELRFVSGHSESCLDDAELCVFSLAVGEDDPELCYAESLGILCVSRPMLLGAVTELFPLSVAVAGSHGKSSVTAMLAALLSSRRPTVICGAGVGADGFISGSGEILVYEACEYRDAFLSTRPTVALLLNLELDHTDYFPDISALEESFYRFASSAERVFYSADDERLARICSGLAAMSFGRGDLADFRCLPLGGRRFGLFRDGEYLCECELSILGDFNLTNATAAAAVASELGLSPEEISAALCDYRGIPRRLERLGLVGGATLLYDYAHHPTEIAAGIDALRGEYGEVSVIFRPHTYSRTEALMEGFVSALGRADRVVLLDVYGAREEAISGVDSAHLARAIGERAVYAESPARAAELLLSVGRGAIVLMGAGDLSEVKEIFEKNHDKSSTPC